MEAEDCGVAVTLGSIRMHQVPQNGLQVCPLTNLDPIVELQHRDIVLLVRMLGLKLPIVPAYLLTPSPSRQRTSARPVSPARGSHPVSFAKSRVPKNLNSSSKPARCWIPPLYHAKKISPPGSAKIQSAIFKAVTQPKPISGGVFSAPPLFNGRCNVPFIA